MEGGSSAPRPGHGRAPAFETRARSGGRTERDGAARSGRQGSPPSLSRSQPSRCPPPPTPSLRRRFPSPLAWLRVVTRPPAGYSGGGVLGSGPPPTRSLPRNPRAEGCCFCPAPPAPCSPARLLLPIPALARGHPTRYSRHTGGDFSSPGGDPVTSSLSSLTSEILTALLTSATRSHEPGQPVTLLSDLECGNPAPPAAFLVHPPHPSAATPQAPQGPTSPSATTSVSVLQPRCCPRRSPRRASPRSLPRHRHHAVRPLPPPRLS